MTQILRLIKRDTRGVRDIREMIFFFFPPRASNWINSFHIENVSRASCWPMAGDKNFSKICVNCGWWFEEILEEILRNKVEVGLINKLPITQFYYDRCLRNFHDNTKISII